MTTTLTAPSAATTSSTIRTAQHGSRFANTPVSVVSALAGLIGAVVVFGYASLAQALSVPMHAGGATIAPSDFSGGVVTCTVGGALLAVALAHWATRPARTFLRATVALTAVSLVFPIIASQTEVSTKVTLAFAHLVAAAIVIPIITRRLSVVRGPASN
jgi:uncharacterized protein DUF6069